MNTTASTTPVSTTRREEPDFGASKTRITTGRRRTSLLRRLSGVGAIALLAVGGVGALSPAEASQAHVKQANYSVVTTATTTTTESSAASTGRPRD
ncbi:hypothetical protein [Rothia kristinae]|uniref:hypothetical protein n=1 Tax=Rothia kristinae TaxID=37923 RepID=UPI0018C9B68D|nr:hypothetical protein [Rothia kristinae]